MTTALITLRAKQAGFNLEELNLITLGFLYEILTEMGNDHYDYPYEATQEDMDKLL